MSAGTFNKIDGKPFVWADHTGLLHAGEGADVHPGIRLLWTACGQKDIPACAAWVQRPEDVVTCPKCLIAAAKEPQP